ncbi:MAG: hypothetical protein EOO65_03865 [Methanosarcinales archaeon]|nr:MAG: hypothetical protein EOO65_03865 [Methanosarcinales archaeon]
MAAPPDQQREPHPGAASATAGSGKRGVQNHCCSRCRACCTRQRNSCRLRRRRVCHYLASAVRSKAHQFLVYWGLQPSVVRFQRALRVTVSIVVSAAVSIILSNTILSRPKGALQLTYSYWAPVTVVFVTGASDGSTYKASIVRLIGTLVGATFGYLAIRLTSSDPIAVGILATLWCTIMQYPRLDPVYGAWGLVASFTAAIIMMGSGGESATASSLALVRIEQTVLGIVIHVIAASIVFPVRARDVVRTRTLNTLQTLADVGNITLMRLVLFVEQETRRFRARQRAQALGKAYEEEVDDPVADDADPTKPLSEVEAFLSALPDLLSEASAEPVLLTTPFLQGRYEELGEVMRRLVRSIRIIHQCLIPLRAQARMYSARRRALAADSGL